MLLRWLVFIFLMMPDPKATLPNAAPKLPDPVPRFGMPSVAFGMEFGRLIILTVALDSIYGRLFLATVALGMLFGAFIFLTVALGSIYGPPFSPSAAPVMLCVILVCIKNTLFQIHHALGNRLIAQSRPDKINSATYILFGKPSR